MSDMANHPIVLHTDLFAEHEHAPQKQFVAERQVAFLEALAVTGSVRAAARRVKVSHQTCYRARRNSAAFGRAWDAALVVARAAAEAKLADCAMNGVEEEVWYHGELVGTRRRLSDRLLLAHLGRLDRLRTDVRIEGLAENFDAMLNRMRRGQAIEVAPPAETAEILSPGPCNMRSMSSGGEGLAEAPDAEDETDPWEVEEAQREALAHAEASCTCGHRGDPRTSGRAHYMMTCDGPQPIENHEGEAPEWPRCRACPHYPEHLRIFAEMDEARPADAPDLESLSGDVEDAGACQIDAWLAGDEDWWRYGADWTLHTRNAAGEWVAEGEMPPASDQGEGMSSCVTHLHPQVHPR